MSNQLQKCNKNAKKKDILLSNSTMLINATNFLHHPSTRNLIPQSIYIKFPPHTTFGYLLLNISFQSSLDAVIGDCAGLISMRLELLPVSV